MTTTLIPESAPFSEEQRAWLNGFLSGFLGISSSVAPPELGLSALPNATAQEPEEDLDNSAWHDPALAIEDRMKLAEGKPLTHRLMAAMAQLDCGSCGYMCKTYSAAIASGHETNLTLCSPGGKATKQQLRHLLREASNSAPPEQSSDSKPAQTTPDSLPVGTRQKPFLAKLIESRPLNKPGSIKDTRHVVIDLGESGIKYQVGDALGVYPTNCPELVRDIIAKLGTEPDCKVQSRSGTLKRLQVTLTEDCCLKEPNEELLDDLIALASTARNREILRHYLSDGIPDGFDVLDALTLADNTQLVPARFVELLSPLNPRLYSIASSMALVGNQVHLTVGKVTYQQNGRIRKGVASTMLADRMEGNCELRVFVQPNHAGFTIPDDQTKPMIMVGPGTGIAPFIAFLQERQARGGTGRNWLFFGDQHQTLDFLYEEQLLEWQATGLLTKLDTAFSRDTEQKVYVQDKMRQRGAELWSWLDAGAHLYVCGDASRMAADVDVALKEIIAGHGNLSTQEAAEFVRKLATEKRYVRDVY